MRFKNIAFAAAVLLIAVTALSGCKGQGESGGNSSAFLKEESVVSSSESQSAPEEISAMALSPPRRLFWLMRSSRKAPTNTPKR